MRLFLLASIAVALGGCNLFVNYTNDSSPCTDADADGDGDGMVTATETETVTAIADQNRRSDDSRISSTLDVASSKVMSLTT